MLAHFEKDFAFVKKKLFVSGISKRVFHQEYEIEMMYYIFSLFLRFLLLHWLFFPKRQKMHRHTKQKSSTDHRTLNRYQYKKNWQCQSFYPWISLYAMPSLSSYNLEYLIVDSMSHLTYTCTNTLLGSLPWLKSIASKSWIFDSRN